MTSLDPEVYLDLVRRALAEDVGSGDRTTNAIVPDDLQASAVLLVRNDCVLSGLPVIEAVFQAVDPAVRVSPRSVDGNRASAGTVIARIEGRAASILTAERTALNFLQRLSGIATLTRKYVEAAAGRVTVLDTRKTTPGLRALEKYAVRCGGGTNHRFGLYDAVLIKDNHIAAAGGLAEALNAVRTAVGHLVKIEVEVDTLDQLEKVLRFPIDAVLLDNMDAGTLKRAIALVKGRVITEASGGVTLESVREIAKT